MSGMWARVCELCSATTPKKTEGWLHQELGTLFQNAPSIDVCPDCCATKTIGDLRDVLKNQLTRTVQND